MTKPERDLDICVITCAVTGVLANRAQCPTIPYTPAEIGEECRRAYEAGAAVAHIHARNDDGTPTASPAVFAEIRREVRRRSPILLNFSTGTISEDVHEHCTYIREVKPQIAAMNSGTMNYAKYSKKRKDMVFDLVFPNTYQKMIQMLTAMNEANVNPELECFDTGHTHGLWPLIDMGILKPPFQYSFIVNVLGGIPPTVESLQLQTKVRVPDTEWEVIGISHCHWRMLAAGLVLGGNIRTGLEDHLYLPSGDMATSNGDMVEVAARLCRDVGRRPASVEEAKRILGTRNDT